MTVPSPTGSYRNSSKQGGRKTHDHHFILQVAVIVQQVCQVKKVHTSSSYNITKVIVGVSVRKALIVIWVVVGVVLSILNFSW